MASSTPFNIESTYLRLRPNASVETLRADAAFWQRLSSGQLGTFHNEYLVTSHRFHGDWPTWEMHPNGDEIVCLLSGAASFLLEFEERTQTIELKAAGSYVVVPKGVWHTAKGASAACMLFITAGEGTLHRPVC